MTSRFKHRIILSSLLFGLFFGAGNLIFPISIGQNAAEKSILSLVGFVTSAVGLAILTVIFIAKTKKENLEESLIPYGKGYARVFTILLLLTIGPLFALPRLATVPYEVSIKSIFSTTNHSLGLFVYSLIFFLVALILALKPNKLKNLIGVIINPLFLGMLLVFFLVFIFKPMGSIFNGTASLHYQENPFLSGFQDGYQTMDVLAAMMFGFIITQANDKPGTDRDLFKDVLFASLFAGLYMLLIYSILGFMGASSLNILEVSSNGGLALGEIFVHYFGQVGLIFFGILITFACLKTAIGLIVSVSTYFSEVTRLSYNLIAIITTVIAFSVSNFGLERIINYAVPVLNFIYPLALMHVLIGLFIPQWEEKVVLIRTTLFFSLIAAAFEVLKSMEQFKHLSFVKFYSKTLPLSNVGISWLNFTLIGLGVGLILTQIKNKFRHTN